MKLQLIYDYNFYDNDDMDDEGAAPQDGYYSYASNVHINYKLPHEKVSFNDAFYRRMEKYFLNSSRYNNKTLIEIPDDIMFQYMIDGLFDYDFIAYDMCKHRIGISNTEHVSTRYRDEGIYNYATKGYSSNSNAENERMFTYGNSTDSENDTERRARKDYHVVPNNEHYSNIAEIVRPYVVYRFVEWFKMGADVIYDTQDIKLKRLTSYDDGEVIGFTKGSSINYLPGERGSTRVYPMRGDQLSLCMKFWEIDHDIFLEARKYISDNEVEAYKALYNMIQREISETK